MGYIYLITNTINGKRYVGQTIQDDIQKRWKAHRDCKKNSCGSYLLNVYKKYGIEKFKFQIICICFDEACNQLEIEYIKKFNTLAPNGYNLLEGGNNRKCHPETKKLLSEMFKGRKVPEEQRIKQSITMTGRKRGPLTKETRSKLSESFKKVWQERRDNGTFDLHMNKIGGINGQFLKGQEGKNKKRVAQYDCSGNLIEEYSSAVEAGIKTNIAQSNISRVCRGGKYCKTAGGFIWKFL